MTCSCTKGRRALGPAVGKGRMAEGQEQGAECQETVHLEGEQEGDGDAWGADGGSGSNMDHDASKQRGCKRSFAHGRVASGGLLALPGRSPPVNPAFCTVT